MYLAIEKVMRLKDIEIFSDIDEDYLLLLAQQMNEIEVPSNTKIITKGEISDKLYIIVSGEVLIHDGKKKISILKEKTVVGELSALDPEPRSADVTTITNVKLFSLEGDSIYSLMEDNIEIAKKIIHILCDRIRSQIGKN